MNKVRLGVIGLGNIGKYHADYLLDHQVSRCELTAVCGTAPQPPDPYRSLDYFNDATALIRSGAVDAVLIATPHYQHTPLAIAALNAGLHVLVEKPIAAHKADAERLLAVHRQFPALVFAAMFQLRTEPRYQKIRQLIREELGEIVRVNWINTDWFRTEAYYASSAWRATWRGEGGGVLLNQCLHNLDLLHWLCGQPARVRGFCQWGRFHQIEVEDNVTAWLEWPNGATGVFVSSTGEAPGTNRLEIAGTRGKLVLEDGQLILTHNSQDMIEFSRTAAQGFVKPETTTQAIPVTSANLPHVILTQNFVNAILDGEPLLAPGADGIYSLELANAITYSALIGQTIQLPLDAAAWETKLQELIAQSKTKKTVIKTTPADFAASFRK